MSFERKVKGNTIQIITAKGFVPSTEAFITDGADALNILLSKGVREIGSVENMDGKIHITKQYLTCPLCDQRLSAYAKNSIKKVSHLKDKIIGLCDNQTKLFPVETISSMEFNRAKRIGSPIKCPHCGHKGVISAEITDCTITAERNRLSVSCNMQTLSEVMYMGWISEEIISFNDVLCSETVTFDIITGAVTVSLTCGNKVLCIAPVASEEFLGQYDPWRLMLGNRQVYQELTASFKKIYGAIPFSDKTLTVDRLILLTKFVGYSADFFHDLPLSMDDENTVLPDDFKNISDRLHCSTSVPNILSETDIPKTKSIKRIIFKRPSLLLYKKELERLWRIIDNIDLFRDLLTCKTTFALLAYLHLYTGTDNYLTDVRRIKGAVWLYKKLASGCCYSLCSRGIEYFSSNPAVKRRLLTDLNEDKYEYGFFYRGRFYFSVPIPQNTADNSMLVNSGFRFILLTTLKEYHTAAKELMNCLDRYPPYNNSQVYIIRKSNKTLAAVEVLGNSIVQAYCVNNTPIGLNPLKKAIIFWAGHNSYRIDKGVLNTDI